MDDAGHVLSPAASTAASTTHSSSAAASSSPPPPPKTIKRTRRSRVVTVTSKEAGKEQREGGEVRVITQQTKVPGIFTPPRYVWLYYAVYPAVGVTIIPVGMLCKSDCEAHAILDPVENVDADAVQRSNSTYELAGVDASLSPASCMQPGCYYIQSVLTASRGAFLPKYPFSFNISF